MAVTISQLITDSAKLDIAFAEDAILHVWYTPPKMTPPTPPRLGSDLEERPETERIRALVRPALDLITRWDLAHDAGAIPLPEKDLSERAPLTILNRVITEIAHAMGEAKGAKSARS